MNSDIRLGFFSDTHTKHIEWKKRFDSGEFNDKWSELDILFFTGDCSSRGSKYEVDDFLSWFNQQPAKHKVMISGNHDFFFDYEYRKKQSSEVIELLDKYPDIHYLNDSGIELFGINIWGSPIQPEFYNWAFNRKRNTIIDADGTEKNMGYLVGGIDQHWNKIPENTDILIVHGPPYGHGDLLSKRHQRRGENTRVGCVDLKKRIDIVRPKIVAFGHIHEGYGESIENDILYINCSSLNEEYSPVNPPRYKLFKNQH